MPDISGFYENFAGILRNVNPPETERVKSLLDNTIYDVFYGIERAVAFIHRDFRNDSPCIFVSCPTESFSDIVGIKKHSEIPSEGPFVASSACAAAIINLMRDGLLPRNVIVNFQREDAWSPYDFPSRSLLNFKKSRPEAFGNLEFVITLGISKKYRKGLSYVVQNPGHFTFKPKPARIKIGKERNKGYWPGMIDFIGHILKDGNVVSEKVFLCDSDLMCWPIENDLYNFIFALPLDIGREIRSDARNDSPPGPFVITDEIVYEYSRSLIKLLTGIFTSF